MTLRITACSHCGSRRIEPAPWEAGALAPLGYLGLWTERPPQIRCFECGRSGIPLEFVSEEERSRFAEECAQGNSSKG